MKKDNEEKGKKLEPGSIIWTDDPVAGAATFITVPDPEEGKKYDKDKLRFDLIPPEAEEGIATVFTFGANKYGDRNWQRGLKVSRLIGSLRRHLNKFTKGIDKDEESGLDEIDHILTNAAMLKWMLIHKPEMDDRFKPKESD